MANSLKLCHDKYLSTYYIKYTEDLTIQFT